MGMSEMEQPGRDRPVSLPVEADAVGPRQRLCPHAWDSSARSPADEI